MKGNSKKVMVFLCFLIVALLLWSGYKVHKDKLKAFEALNIKTENFAASTPSRVSEAVVTLPDGNLLVGLHDNISEYTSKYVVGKSTVTIQNKLLKTKFIPGIFEKKVDPRIDAIVPMYVNADSQGGSLYVVLFKDRGDVALEESYARLGGPSATVHSIEILPADTAIVGEEYKVDIMYTSSKQKEVIIPVIDGRFDSKGTISK